MSARACPGVIRHFSVQVAGAHFQVGFVQYLTMQDLMHRRIYVSGALLDPNTHETLRLSGKGFVLPAFSKRTHCFPKMMPGFSSVLRQPNTTCRRLGLRCHMLLQHFVGT